MQRIEAQMEAITIENRNLLAFAEASVSMVNNLLRSGRPAKGIKGRLFKGIKGLLTKSIIAQRY